MAPGPDRSLYVSIPGKGGVVVALLGPTGKPRPGWPLLLPGVDGCDLLLPVGDGSVRVVCTVRPTADGLQVPIRRAFAIDQSGRSMHGWPVDIDDGFAGRMIGDELRIVAAPYLGDTPTEELAYLLGIRADGTVRKGVSMTVCCDNDWAVGPDGIAYQSNHRDWSPTGLANVTTDYFAFGFDGPVKGWPVTFHGNGSELSFDASGRVHVVVGSPEARPTRAVVIDQDGQILSANSGDQAIISSSPWDGAGDAFPGRPIVADDGTSFIVSTQGGRTTVLGLDPSGQPLPGWPYASKVGMEWTGFCGSGDTGCGFMRTYPAVGPGNLLYLFHAAASKSVGGSMVAIDHNGRIRNGWPVGLRRAGSMFWSMVVAPDGGVWALAIEPEKKSASATILSIAADSTVRYSTTIVEP